MSDPSGDQTNAPAVTTPGAARPTRSPGRIARSILAVLFGVIGVIGVLASVVGVWAHRTVFNSETVAEAVDQALLNPEVNEALAAYLTDQVMDAVPLEDMVSEKLPSELEPFVPVLVGGVRNVVHEGFTRVLEDGRAREALVAVVERAHEAVMRVLEGGGLRDGITIEGKDVKVNLLPLLSRGLERIQDRGILTRVDLPTFTADGDPKEQIAQLEDALGGRDLPDDFGQLVVYSSDNVAKSKETVARAQNAFVLFRRSIVGLVLLTVVSLGVSAALANNRRRAAIALLLSVVAALLVGRVLVRTVVEQAPTLASKPGGRAALEELVTSLTQGLLRLVSVGLVVAAALALVAFLLGNKRAMRGLQGAASAGAGARGVVDEHRDATAMVSVALALLVITLTGFSWFSLLATLILLGVAGWAAWAPRPPDAEAGESVDAAEASADAPEEPVG